MISLNNRSAFWIFVISIAISAGCARPIPAAVYYVDPSVAEDSGNGSAGSPKKYITSGIKLMSSGDTLMLKDGVYTGKRNLIGDFASPRVYPPDGSPRSPTFIRAEHAGQAIIDAGYESPAFSSENRSVGTNYVNIEGIHFRRGNYGVFNIKGTHNKIMNCGFEDGMPASSNDEVPIAVVAGGSSYTLVEDCWVWGKGRYGFYTSSPEGGTNHVVFRRVVVRLDDTPGKWMTAGLRFYNGKSNAMQNCIVIDSNIGAEAGEPAAFISGGGSSSGEPDHVYIGVIALDNPRMKGFVPEKGARTNTVYNSVFWGNSDGVFTVPAFNPPFTLNLANLTIGENKGFGVRSNPAYSGMKVNIIGSLLQVPDEGTAFNDPNFISGTAVFVPGKGTLGSNPGGYKIISSKVFEAGLRYLPRIESGSTLAAGGIGANILYQIGISGTLYGDPGWDATTEIPLWPFPNERLWADKMKSYNSSGPGGDRGFAAVNSSSPLTDYIWGYLGKTVPPFNVKVTPGDGQAVLSWDLNTADTDITGYKVYVEKMPGKNGSSSGVAVKTLGNVASTTIAGLSNGNTYYFAVTAIDRKRGESGFSYKKSVKLPKMSEN